MQGLSWSVMVAQTELEQAKPESNLIAEGEHYWWGDRLFSGAFGDTTAAGIRFTEQQALTVSALYACSRAIAENLGSLPGIVYRQEKTSRSVARDADPWHLLHDEPNPEMDSMTFFELAGLRLENRGNAFAEIQRDESDRPIALWPIHNSRVEPWRIDGEIHWKVSLDSADPRYEEVNRWYTIPDRDMLNIVGFGGNGYLAPGVIHFASEQVGFAIGANQFGSNFFKTGARPAGFVEMPGYIDDATLRAEFRSDLNKAHSKENWHKIGVLWNGGKWREMQYSPEQSQFIQSAGFSDKRICQFYRVPPSIVQIYDDFKFSSVDAMLQSFVMTCLRPIAIRFERAINRKILRVRSSTGRLMAAFDSPYIFEFLLEALLRGDAKKQAETLELKRRNGIINSDEWRALENDPPLPNGQGKHYIIPGGFQRLDQMENQSQGGNASPGQGNSNSSTKSGSTSSSLDQEGPSYDREKLIQAIEQSSLLPKKPQVRGFDPDELSEAIEDLRSEAIERIEQVAKTELARIGKVTDEATKTAKTNDLKSKHLSRLRSALVPVAKVYAKANPDLDFDAVAKEWATEAAGSLFGKVLP